jgi:peptidoglycan pentaglycine glycine transferase (the first glycine)
MNHFLQSQYWRACKDKLGNKTYSVGDYFFQTTKLPIFKGNVGYMPRVDLTKIDWQLLLELGKSANCVFITVDPLNLFDEFEIKPEDSKEFKVAKGIPVHMQKTLILDLEKSEEELLSQMKQKHRYNIKVATKHGVVVKIDDSEDSFETFIKLYQKTVQRQGYSARNENYIRTVWEELRDFGSELPLVTIATAYYQGKPLVSWMLFLYGDTIIYPYGGSSEEFRNVMAPYAIAWEIIKWGKENGYKKFDLFGLENEENDGYTRFKLGFGGDVIKYADTVDLVIDEKKYRVVKLAYKLREKVGILKKLF